MPGRPTHAAASVKKSRKGTGEDRNSSLVVPNALNTSTNPDVTHEFFAPENQGVTSLPSLICFFVTFPKIFTFCL